MPMLMPAPAPVDRRRRPHLLALLAALVLVACGPVALDTPAPSTLPATDSSTDVRELELEISDAVNERRREHGLEALQQREDLAAVARSYSRRVLEEGSFDHVDPQGEEVADRLRAVNITFSTVGENLYFGAGPVDHVQTAVDGWMDSPGHREVMLSEMFSQTGAGMARGGNEVRVTQIFLRP